MGPGKQFLALVSVSAVMVIAAVHYQQKFERDEMRKGVLRDKERIKAKAALDLEKRSS